jgi:hypothetical protein
MKLIIVVFLVLSLLGGCTPKPEVSSQEYEAQLSSSQTSDEILSKEDAEHIFSLTRNEWEFYAKNMVHPYGWQVQLGPHDTGTSVMAFDPNTGMGLSIQPLYYDNTAPPDSLVVGSYYPSGSLQTFSEELRQELEKEASRDLGPNYFVSASHTKFLNWEGVLFTVSKK